MKTKIKKQDVELIVDGLNALSRLVQKMMQSIERTEGNHPSFKVLDTRGCTKEFLIERIILGVWLLSAKKDMKHGEFEAFRQAKGISARTGVYIMNVAKRFLQDNATPVPEISKVEAWAKQADIREALESFVGDKSWRKLIGLSKGVK